MIDLREVRMEEKELLWKINQKYLYEMTAYYPEPFDENGDYHYGWFDAYFTDPERKAFFLFADDAMIGFAFINPYSYIGHAPDHVMAEFTVFPAYRRRHYALEAARVILSSYPGHWEIKYNEKNTGAKKLWTAVTEPYSPKVYHLNDAETVFEFTV